MHVHVHVVTSKVKLYLSNLDDQIHPDLDDYLLQSRSSFQSSSLIGQFARKWSRERGVARV